jgi:p-aminobenzoyl-glutamate transporter AbgT
MCRLVSPFRWMLPDVALNYYTLIALGGMIFTAAGSPTFAGLAALLAGRRK